MISNDCAYLPSSADYSALNQIALLLFESLELISLVLSGHQHAFEVLLVDLLYLSQVQVVLSLWEPSCVRHVTVALSLVQGILGGAGVTIPRVLVADVQIVQLRPKPA